MESPAIDLKEIQVVEQEQPEAEDDDDFGLSHAQAKPAYNSEGDELSRHSDDSTADPTGAIEAVQVRNDTQMANFTYT